MTTLDRAAPPVEDRRDRTAAGLVTWAAVVAAGLVWGTLFVARAGQGIGAAPFVGRWDGQGGARLLGAVAFGAAAVAAGPRLAATAPWHRVVVGTGAAAAAWATLLAAGDGWATPFEHRADYLRLAVSIESPLEFLRTFTERAASYPVHVEGHPPGATLVFWALDGAGLAGPGWAAVVAVLAWGAAAAAAVVALAEVAGREPARRAAPFVALAPAAVWAGFSADAMFAGAIAVPVALVVVATGRHGRQGTVLAGLGGAGLAVALHLTYGAAPLLLVPAAVLVRRRRFDLVAPCALGAAAVVGGFLAAGFWWLDGLAVTHRQYWAGVASRRPWPYHLLAGNPAVLAVATGPALAAGWSRVRGSRPDLWLLPAAAAAALLLANLSGLSKGEVERIWLPYCPWALTATAFLAPDRSRWWLAANVGLGVVVQASLRSPW